MGCVGFAASSLSLLDSSVDVRPTFSFVSRSPLHLAYPFCRSQSPIHCFAHNIILPTFLLDSSLPKSLQFQQHQSPLFPKALPSFHQNHISNSSNFEHDMPSVASTHDQDVFSFYEDEHHRPTSLHQLLR